MKSSLAKVVGNLGQTRKADTQSDVPVEDNDIIEDAELDELDPGFEPEEKGDTEEYEPEEAASPEAVKKVLDKVSSDLETLVDSVMEINKKKEYSKLVRLLRAAARLSDELNETEDLLK